MPHCFPLRANTPSAPVNHFVGQIQRALSCITGAHLVRSHSSTVPGGVRSIIAPRAGFAPLQGERRLHFSAALEYQVIEKEDAARGERWQVQTERYRYHVVADDMAEIMAFHWLPGGQCSTEQPRRS